jgi:hypothetical protein
MGNILTKPTSIYGVVLLCCDVILLYSLDLNFKFFFLTSQITPDPIEVAEVQILPVSQLIHSMKHKTQHFTPWFCKYESILEQIQNTGYEFIFASN